MTFCVTKTIVVVPVGGEQRWSLIAMVGAMRSLGAEQSTDVDAEREEQCKEPYSFAH